MLSVVIPSYKDVLVHKTVESLLDNSEGAIEIIVVIDGYKMKKALVNDIRVIGIQLDKNVGMREAINRGVYASKGEYIMRTDEHCMFGKGFDRLLTEDIGNNWIVTPSRYKLDVNKWDIIGYPPIDHEKLVILKTRQKFASQTWRERDILHKDELICEKMAMQGSCWLMARKHWQNVIKRLDSNGYGTHYQDSVEMVFKTWQAGGKLMLNRKTWYAHKHRKFKRTHGYKRALADASFKFSLDLWGDYYKNVVMPKWGLV